MKLLTNKIFYFLLASFQLLNLPTSWIFLFAKKLHICYCKEFAYLSISEPAIIETLLHAQLIWRWELLSQSQYPHKSLHICIYLFIHLCLFSALPNETWAIISSFPNILCFYSEHYMIFFRKIVKLIHCGIKHCKFSGNRSVFYFCKNSTIVKINLFTFNWFNLPKCFFLRY